MLDRIEYLLQNPFHPVLHKTLSLCSSRVTGNRTSTSIIDCDIQLISPADVSVASSQSPLNSRPLNFEWHGKSITKTGTGDPEIGCATSVPSTLTRWDSGNPGIGETFQLCSLTS
ncbi:unnamed protein product [Fusarium graminearum]|uniref:Chromosome 1, complete genome n=1 Tax=Gibberella zeae (strain ATCC MYA-4620 / CBS 123657 / FGSC 9075 / NRRL 31084 / PH-1) TaxID=229533 RepID=I1S4M1_GIBZE|nr:hypothetical protein FGSG_11789 [Fusarium graminearum PH-1]ESU05788.1 hypothetical protein FGSG_11789 [Fusarium graminearum PH-1]CEF72548.1 unnamed protein product [Fusarium graminearum]CZS75812.1 unnamed protein product [Fusarium graminearum]|eukprot:XP_011316273.1 hypothetical protein FGSG_11789 [Fusarium graminearum PH-1]